MRVTRPEILTPFLEEIVNHVLRLDPQTLTRLGELQGKVIGLRLSQPAARPAMLAPELFCRPSEAGLRITARYDGKPDVMISGNVPLFAKMVLGGAYPETLGSGELQISGDIELGQSFKKILDQIEIDWEEQSSDYLGDILAHKLASVARGVHRWQKQARETLIRDVVEYFQEERRDLPQRSEVDGFLQAVDDLCADTERLQARLQRLQGLGQ